MFSIVSQITQHVLCFRLSERDLPFFETNAPKNLFCEGNRGSGSDASLGDTSEQCNTRPDHHMIFSSLETVQTRQAKGDVARSKLV